MGEHGDTTEVSGRGAGGGEEDSGEDTESDSAAYKDSNLERDAPRQASPPRGKSSASDAAEQAGGGARVVVDLASSSNPGSAGSSSVSVSKPSPSIRRTKELETAARKAQAAPPKLVMKERRSKSAADRDAGVA